VRLDQPGQPLPERGGVAPLDRGHQPQIPLGECDAWVVVRERTQRSSRAGAGHRVGEPLAMGRATCTVEDNAGQRQMRIEPLEAEHDGRSTARERADVHHQKSRGPRTTWQFAPWSHPRGGRRGRRNNP
jgi:hypothetical protein